MFLVYDLVVVTCSVDVTTCVTVVGGDHFVFVLVIVEARVTTSRKPRGRGKNLWFYRERLKIGS